MVRLPLGITSYPVADSPTVHSIPLYDWIDSDAIPPGAQSDPAGEWRLTKRFLRDVLKAAGHWGPFQSSVDARGQEEHRDRRDADHTRPQDARVVLDASTSTNEWANIVNAALNTAQTIALAYFAARWKPNGKQMQLCSPVAALTTVGPEHPTSGLPGYPAHDWFAPAGTAVLSPVAGVVSRLSGHPPADGPISGPHGPFGWSVYIDGRDGRSYYLTHLGTRLVRVGSVLKLGDQIGTVGNYAKYGTPSHVHMGVRGAQAA